MRGWWVPVIVAVVLHLVLISLLLMGWDSAVEFKPAVVPQHIQAKVVELKPKTKKVSKAKKPKKPPVKKTTVKKEKIKKVPVKPKLEKQIKKPVITKTAKPPEKIKKEPIKPKVDEKKRQAEQERLAEQNRLQALADSLAQEELKRKLELEQAQVQSYSQQIRSDIESKWSRPPSARNGMEVTLMIQLVPGGELIDVKIIKPSGNDAFDTSAVNAVRKVQVFNVPKEYELFDQYFRKLTLPFRAEGLSR
ncbi:MAG: energy transducer TonB [Pseudomonadales bacterium]|nr:energy transducer TonB [Pseudomonadales bacterium]